ncbi:MAG: hypothetical protein ACOCQD_01270 [archaeon]
MNKEKFTKYLNEGDMASRVAREYKNHIKRANEKLDKLSNFGNLSPDEQNKLIELAMTELEQLQSMIKKLYNI